MEKGLLPRGSSVLSGTMGGNGRESGTQLSLGDRVFCPESGECPLQGLEKWGQTTGQRDLHSRVWVVG